MNLRMHHLVCMRSFKGKGYSKEFVDNFYNIIKKIKKDPIIKIINSPDVICEKCLYNKNGCIKNGPDSEQKVKDKDNKFIGLLKLKINSRKRANWIIKIVNDRTRKKDIIKICKNCEWLNYCIKNWQ